MEKRYLTRAQKAVLRCLAENGGRATIVTGVRWSVFLPGYAHIFAQGMHSLLHNRWLTTRGQNQPWTYAWTDEGKQAFERGWYIPKVRPQIWETEAPFAAGQET